MANVSEYIEKEKQLNIWLNEYKKDLAELSINNTELSKRMLHADILMLEAYIDDVKYMVELDLPFSKLESLWR